VTRITAALLCPPHAVPVIDALPWSSSGAYPISGRGAWVLKSLGYVEIEAELDIGRCLLASCSQNLPFGFCMGNLALRGKCGAACEMPECIGHSHARFRCR